MTPQRLRAYVLIVVRDILIPLGGLYLTITLTATHRFEPWHLPLVAGMMSVPLVSRGGSPEPDMRGDDRPEPE